jgi:hypothetical protein
MTDSSSRSPEHIRLVSWTELADALVRGLAHALSNRVAALMALMDLGPGDLSADESQLFPREIDRLQDINRLLKLLPADIHARVEAVLPRDVLSDAIALMSVHPRGKEIDFQLQIANDQPVRVERWALLRLLLIILEAARESALARGAHRVDVSIGGDEQLVTVTALGSRFRAASDPIAELLVRTDAMFDASESALTLRLPTLVDIRRRGRATTA